MAEGKPTIGASKRFEKIAGMLSVMISTPKKNEEAEQIDGDPIEGTIVDISAGCLCVRVSIDQAGAKTMSSLSDGDYVEARVIHSSQRQWTVLGHLAWIWAPTMEGSDTIGSLGIDIAGVIEQDKSLMAKLRSVFSREQVIDVKKAPRPHDSPSRVRRRK